MLRQQKQLSYIAKFLDPDSEADINYSNERTNPPLCLAIVNRRLDLVERLIDKGANPNAVSCNGDTPLNICIRNRLKDFVECLITRGANVCKPDRDKQTPLSVAVLTDDLEMVRFLLNNGAAFNMQTAFLDAIQSDKLEMVKFFITKGVSVNFKYTNGWTPLTATIEKKNSRILEELFKCPVDVNVLGKNGVSPLVKSMEIRNSKIFNKLIEAGADVNRPDKSGTYPLVKSIEMDNFEMLKVLVEGAIFIDYFVINQCGHTALTRAVANENFEIVSYLVEHGADVNQIDNNQKTPLSIAAMNSDMRTFEFLTRSGANIDLAIPQLEEIARNDDDFSVYFEEFSKNIARKIQPATINSFADSAQEEG